MGASESSIERLMTDAYALLLRSGVCISVFSLQRH